MFIYSGCKCEISRVGTQRAQGSEGRGPLKRLSASQKRCYVNVRKESLGRRDFLNLDLTIFIFLFLVMAGLYARTCPKTTYD